MVFREWLIIFLILCVLRALCGELLPIEMINIMDYVCINGTYYAAGSPEALAAVDTNLNGITDESDIYPHRLMDVYIKMSDLQSPQYASSTNYDARFPLIDHGFFGRVFLLTEYEFNVGNRLTMIHLDPQDEWLWFYGSGIFPTIGLKNQTEYANGVSTIFYPLFKTLRGINVWTGIRFDNPAYPAGATCPDETMSDVSGPAGVEIP